MVLVADRPVDRVCPVDDQPADGGDLGVVRFPGDAGSALVNPVPRSAAARRSSTAQRGGLLAHLDRPKSRSRLRVREPRRLPRGLDRAETAALLGSFRTDRDRAIAGLMLFSGLRSAEVLGLAVRDVDIPPRWVRVVGKGDKERRVPLDVDVAGLVQTYLLAERPDSEQTTLFLVAKGSHRGQPLTPAGLRTVFRYHRAVAGVPAGHPHALRHSFGTALAEAGVDLAVLQALMGHDQVDSSAAYIHLAPTHVRASYDAARARQRADGDRPAPSGAVSCSAAIWRRWPSVARGTPRSGRPRGRSWPAGRTRRTGRASRCRCGCRRGRARPFLNFLMLAGILQPGYDYLLERKLSALLRESRTTRSARELDRFLTAAAELGYRRGRERGMASQVAVRLLIQTGRTLGELTEADFAEFDAAISRPGTASRRAASSTTGGRCYASRAVHLPPGRARPPAPVQNDRAPALALGAALRPACHRRSAIAGRLPGVRRGHPRPIHRVGHRRPAGSFRPAPHRHRPGADHAGRAGPATTHRALPGRGRRGPAPAHRRAAVGVGTAQPDPHRRPDDRRHQRVGLGQRPRPGGWSSPATSPGCRARCPATCPPTPTGG